MEPVFNFIEMFQSSLKLEDPWKIERAEYQERDQSVHLYVQARANAKYPCPICGHLCTRYDDEEEERIWRHNDVVLYPCYVHCRRPRVQCPEHGIHVVQAPWARDRYSRYTLAFEGWAIFLLQHMSIKECSRALRLGRQALTRIASYWVNRALAEEDLSAITHLSLDETSFKRGHRYVTVIGAPKERRVIGVEEGRGIDAVEAFSLDFEARGGDCEAVQEVSMDMSAAYRAGSALCFPRATVVYEHFHVKKLVLDAMDEVRKEEQGRRFSRSRQAGRKLLMLPESRLSEAQTQRLQSLQRSYPKTGRAWRMVQVLDDFYRCMNLDEATEIFRRLTSWMMHSRLEPMKAAARSLRAKKKEILAYFANRISNAFAEGMNSIIQTAKRKARGFRTFEGFRTAIFLAAGRLSFACPVPFLHYYAD